MKVKVEFRVARNRLPQVGPAVRNALAKVVRDTASDVAVSAQSLAPVATGKLRDNTQPRDTEDPLVWEVVSSQPYAGFVEYGTYKMDAQPFLTPAFEAHEDQFLRDAAQAIEAAAKRAG